jgi:Uma2 family endonuclease
MAVQDRIRKLTYDDYARIPDDGQRHEIIDGEHYVSPAPLIPHQGLSIELGSRLHLFVKSHRLGRVFHAACDVVLSKHDIVQPDLLFVSNARARIVTERNIQGAPDLIVEILSDSTRRLDETVKLDLYDRYGVSEYWTFDTDRKTSRVYRRTLQGLRLMGELSAEDGDVLATPLLPGLEIPLVEIFG